MASKEDIKQFQNYLNMGFSPEGARIKVYKDKQRAEKELIEKEEKRKKEEWNKKSIGEKALHYAGEGAGFVKNTAGAFVGEIPSITGNLGKLGSDIITYLPGQAMKGLDAIIPDSIDGGYIAKGGEALQSTGDYIQAGGNYLKEGIKDVVGVERGSVGDTVGSLSAQIGSMFVPLTGGAKIGSLAQKGLQGFDKGEKILKTGSKVLEKGKNIYDKVDDFKYGGKLLTNSLKGSKDMAKFSAISKGEITSDDLANGAMFGAGFHLAGKGYNGVKKFIGNKSKNLSEKLMVTNLINPGKLDEINERLIKLGQSEVKSNQLSQWMLKNNIKGSKEQIQKQLTKGINTASNKVDELLNSNTTKINNEVTESLKKALSEDIYNYTKKVGGQLIPTAGNESKVEAIKNLISKKEMSFKEINEARKIIGDNLFKQSGSLKESVAQEGWQNVWKNASKFLDDNIENFRKYNKNIEVGKALKGAIAKKEANEASRQMAGYMGFGAVSGGGASLATDGDIVKAIKNAAIGGMLGWGGGKVKNFLNSPEVTTRIGTLLSKLGPKDAKVVENFIKTGKMNGFTAGFSDRLKEKIKSFGKDLVPKSNFTNSQNFKNLEKQIKELENFKVIKKEGFGSKFKTLENIKGVGVNKKYLDNMKNLFYGKKNQVEVGKVSLDNGKNLKVLFENGYFGEIINKHGKFNLKNFLITVNNPNHIVKLDRNRLNLIREIEGGKNYFIVSIKEFKEGVYVINHSQILNKTDTSLKTLFNKGKIIFGGKIGQKEE